MTTSYKNKSIANYIDELKYLSETANCGRNNMAKYFGEELAEDIAPLLRREFSCIKALNEKYNYLEKFHEKALARYRTSPLELRRIKEETSSFMTDKWCYFSQINYNIKCIKKITDGLSKFDNIWTV